VLSVIIISDEKSHSFLCIGSWSWRTWSRKNHYEERCFRIVKFL